MFDDLFITLKHEGYLSLCFDGWVRTTIKTGNPRPFQGTVSDQVGTTSSDEGSVMELERRGQVIAVELGPTGNAGRSPLVQRKAAAFM